MTGVPLNIDWQQILLHLFNFTILFGALYILLYKPVRDFMAKRTAYYADMDTRAEDALKAAEESRESYDDARTEAEREKEEIISSAQKEITDMVTGAMEKLTLEQSASDAFDQFLDAAEKEK